MRLRSPWALAVWTAAALYAGLLSLESVADHDAFRTGFDAAIYDQRLWLLAHFEPPFSTIETRPFLAGHFEPALVLLTPLYWLGLGLPGLLIAQSLALAAVAPALYGVARTAGAPAPLATLPAFLWLVSPAVAAVNLAEFRLATFVPVVVAVSVLAVLSDRLVLFGVLMVLALGIKEDVSLVYVMLGALFVIQGRRRLGIVVAIAAAAWAVVALLSIRSLATSDEFFARRFAGDRGDSVQEALLYVAQNPLKTLADVLGHSGPDLVVLLLSTGGLAFLAPSWLLLALPAAAHNALSAYEPQHTLIHHYHLPVVTASFVAAALGVARAGRLRRASRLALACGVVAALAIGVVGGVTQHDLAGRLSEAERAELARALRRIPADAPVAAAPHLLPRLSQRKEVYSFPEPFVRIDWGGSLSEEELVERARRVRFVALTGDIKPVEYEAEIGAVVQRLLERDFVVVERSPVRNLLILERR